MDWRRIVELHSEVSGSHGSGYLLTSNLVLTARHVVDRIDAIDLRLLEPDEHGLPGGVGPWQRARVAWRGADIDAALLVAEHDAFAHPEGAVRIGRLESQASLRVTAAGFPRFIAAASHGDLLYLEAQTDALTAARADALRLALSAGHRPAQAQGWRGMSGAAVWAGDVLVGVLQAVPEGVDASALEALRAYRLLDDTDAAALLAEAGVQPAGRLVDAAYVDALPRVGHWRGLREQYARAVVANLLSVDHVGFAVGGAAARRMPALAAYAAQRFVVHADLMPGAGVLDALGLLDIVHTALNTLVRPPAASGRQALDSAVVAGTPRAVLAGEGGAGKSTSLKQLLALAARGPAMTVPVWVTLAALPREGKLGVETLLDHLVARAKPDLGVYGVTAEFFKSLADDGQIVFGFDALDECGTLDRRQRVRDLLVDVALRWPRCQLIVTTRPDALRDTPLPLLGDSQSPESAKFCVYGLAPFTRDDIAPFLCVAFEDGAALAEDILSRTGIEALTQTPLMLTLVGLVARAGGAGLPTTRTQTFARCLDTVCESWESAKSHGDPGDGLAPAARLDVLRRLGWEAQCRGGVELSALQAGRAIEGADAVPDRATRERVLQGLARRNLILRAETGAGGDTKVRSLRFAHPQFREYLAGAHLAAWYERAAAPAEQAMATRWLDIGWLDVLRFALGTVADEPELRDGLLAAALRADDPWRDLLHRPEFLVARLLARLPAADAGIVARVTASLEQAALEEPALRDAAAKALLALTQHASAVPAIERFARGGGIALAFDAGALPDDDRESSAFEWRLSAIAALARARGMAAALPLLLALPAPTCQRLRQVCRTRATIGDRAGAIDALRQRFEAPEREFELGEVLDTMDEIDAGAIGDGWLARLLDDAHALSVHRARLARKRGLLADDAPQWTTLFERARTELLALGKDEIFAPQLSADAVYAALDDLGATTPASRALAEAALHHRSTVWYAGPRAMQIVPSLSGAAVAAMTDYLVDLLEPSKGASLDGAMGSRFNGTLAAVLATADTAIVLPPLRRLLDHAPVDGPHWPQIAEALSRHGHVHVALAVLRPRLDVPASVHDGARDECVRGVPWALADRLDRVTTHAWLRELYLPGADPVAEANRLMAIWNVSGIAGVARGWFESIGNDKADAAGHAFLHQLTTHERDTAFTDFARHALYGGVFDDSWKADRRDADGDEPLTAERALERLRRLRRIDADLERRTDSDDPYEERKPDRAFCTLLQQSEVLLGRDAVRDEAEHWLDEAVVPVADDDLRVERLLSRLNLLLHAGISDPRCHVRVADEARRLRGDNRTELVSWLALNS